VKKANKRVNNANVACDTRNAPVGKRRAYNQLCLSIGIEAIDLGGKLLEWRGKWDAAPERINTSYGAEHDGSRFAGIFFWLQGTVALLAACAAGF
jgi:hypothetical protein